MANCIVCRQEHDSTSSSAYTRMPCCKNTIYTDCLTYYCLSNHRGGKAKCPHCANKFITSRVLQRTDIDDAGETEVNDHSPCQPPSKLVDNVEAVTIAQQPILKKEKTRMSDNQLDYAVRRKEDDKPVQAFHAQGKGQSLKDSKPAPMPFDYDEICMIPCEEHPDEIYVMFCMKCFLPLCVSCLPDHTSHLPSDLKSANNELAAIVHQLIFTVTDNDDVISQRTRDSVQELASLSLNEYFLHGQQFHHTSKHVEDEVRKGGKSRLGLRKKPSFGATGLDRIKFGAVVPKTNVVGAVVPEPPLFGAAAPEPLRLDARDNSDSDDEEAGVDERWQAMVDLDLPAQRAGGFNEQRTIRDMIRAARPVPGKNQMEIAYDQRKEIHVDRLEVVKLANNLLDMEVDIVALTSLGDELFLLNAATHEVLVVTLQMFLMRSLGTDDLKQPSGLAVMPSREHVAVADGVDGVKVLHATTGQLVKTIGHQGQLGSANDVAVTPGGKVIVADVQRRKVVMFDVQGDVILELEQEPSGRGQFEHPAHVAYSALDEGRIVVHDTGARRVKVMSSKDGRCCYYYAGGRGTQPGKLSATPGGLCVDVKGHVLIVDPRFRNIHVISASSGDFLGRINVQRSFQRDPPPTMVTVTEAGFLVVASRDGCCVLFMFELD